jgi:hypothetical protein
MNTSGAVALGPLPVTQKIVSALTDVVIANPAFPTFPLALQIPTNSPLEQQRFAVYASGAVNCAASSTVDIKLWSGSSLTPASNVLLGDSGAITAFAGGSSWWVNADLIFDSVSGKLHGTAAYNVNNIVVAAVEVLNVVTGISNSKGPGPVASFVLSVAFGTANAANTITIDEFAVNW